MHFAAIWKKENVCDVDAFSAKYVKVMTQVNEAPLQYYMCYKDRLSSKHRSPDIRLGIPCLMNNPAESVPDSEAPNPFRVYCWVVVDRCLDVVHACLHS